MTPGHVIDHPSTLTSAQPIHRAGRTFVRPSGDDAVTGAERALADLLPPAWTPNADDDLGNACGGSSVVSC